MCLKNSFNKNKGLFISMAGFIALALAILFVVSTKTDEAYETAFKDKLSSIGYMPEKISCFYRQDAKVCEAENLISRNTDNKIEKVRITHPENIYKLAKAASETKASFKVELLNIQTKDGDSILLKEYRKNLPIYEGMGLAADSAEEMERHINFLRTVATPLNISFKAEVTTLTNGDIKNTDVLLEGFIGKDIKIGLGANNISIDNLKSIQSPEEFARMFKFSKVFVFGDIPDDNQNILIQQSQEEKDEIVKEFNSQSEVFAELYGLDENLTKTMSEKLRQYLNDNKLKFKVTLENKNRDDLEWVIGSFTKAVLTNQFRLDGELLKDYKITLE